MKSAFALAVWLAALSGTAAQLAVAADRPNFIVFLTDDQGWGDLACYGHPVIKSPNLDRFATQSVRFTQAYSACGVCSPSRSAILTGRTPYRNGVWRWIPAGNDVHLKQSEITIATLLKAKGYDTCHAGKWHLNGNITQLDDAFGTLMQGIDKLGYTDTTAVFFTSDNGPEGNGLTGRTRGSTGGLRGRKRADFEGGIRVPGMFRYPAYFQAHGVQAGSVSDVPVVGQDIFSTVCELAGVPVPSDRVIDGVSILPALKGQPLKRPQPLYWRTHISPKECRVALRVDDWKIVADTSMTHFLLFNVQDDAKEVHDLASAEPARLARMKQMLIDHDKAVRTDGGTINSAEDHPAKAGKKRNRKK